jgi:DNA-binding FrmR family transcriptional regulator
LFLLNGKTFSACEKVFLIELFTCWQENCIKKRIDKKDSNRGGRFMEEKIETVDKQQGHEHEHEHTHQLADGSIIRHTHGHQHSHTQTKAVLNRMSRLIGHLEAIKRMVEDGRDCSEVLVQLSAVRSAINGVSKIILKDHMEHCVVDAVRDNDKEALEQLNKAIDQFLK